MSRTLAIATLLGALTVNHTEHAPATPEFLATMQAVRS